jgi:hypothetical protein
VRGGRIQYPTGVNEASSKLDSELTCEGLSADRIAVEPAKAVAAGDDFVGILFATSLRPQRLRVRAAVLFVVEAGVDSAAWTPRCSRRTATFGWKQISLASFSRKSGAARGKQTFVDRRLGSTTPSTRSPSWPSRHPASTIAKQH